MPLINELLHETIDRITSTRRLPESTYRVQLHAGFTFRDAAAIVPYLHDLGVTHLYLSPCMRARPGSTHGYDIVDYNCLNPELGGQEGFTQLLQALSEHGMQQILDTVPNHMGVGTNDNAWWNDVLENGPVSIYAGHFDITWQGPSRASLHNKVLLPVLGGQYGSVLEKGELKLVFDEAGLGIQYYQRRFPINMAGYARILAHRGMVQELGETSPAAAQYRTIIESLTRLPDKATTRDAALGRHTEKELIKQRLQTLARESSEIRRLIQGQVDAFNGTPGNPSSFDILDDLLASQSYRLAYWRTAPDEINYRRFFDINDLAATQMEREEVFHEAHALTLRLAAEGAVAGLRIDHPDGLYDPQQYFLRLQRDYILACAKQTIAQNTQYDRLNWQETRDEMLARIPAVLEAPGDEPLRWPLYVVAEKILASGEPLPQAWAVFGTSGYDALNAINGLFVDPTAQGTLTSLYTHWVGDQRSFEDLCYEKKLLILRTSLASEVHMLAYQLDRLAQSDRHWQDFTLNGLREAIVQTIACFPVYRCYVCSTGPLPADVAHVEFAITQAIARNPRIDPPIFHFIRDTLLQQNAYALSHEQQQLQCLFSGKFQQVTAPATAKGVEDTALYIYNRLISLNEVGGDPARFGTGPDELHTYLQQRQKQHPYALSALSTHDTKRGEDVRARVNVLAEMADEWMRCLMRWSTLNAGCRHKVDGADAPSRNDEYLLYQTLIGAWPETAGAATDVPIHNGPFIERIQQYMLKAIREAKVLSSWTEPNEPYEAAVMQFVARILEQESKFLLDFRSLHGRIARVAAMNSLAQTVLRLTMPGVPDTYQGTELFEFTLVDPDNRQPVDYDLRRQLLGELRTKAQQGLENLARDLAGALDSHAKLYVIWQALQARNRHPGLFSVGEYYPIRAEGPLAGNVFAFARRHAGRCALVAVPRLVTKLHPRDGAYTGPSAWADTHLIWPDVRCSGLKSILDGRPAAPEGRLTLADLFATLPVAVLVSE